MNKSKTVALLGNCQAAPLEKIITLFSRNVTFAKLKPIHLLDESDFAVVSEALDRADIILFQTVSESYQLEWVRPSYLRSKYSPSKEIYSCPVIYFDGYFPDTQYVYLNDYGRLKGPLGDYHLGGVIKIYKDRIRLSEAADVYNNLDIAGPNCFRHSLENLRHRETACDIIISDFIEKHAREQRLFYTPNHPTGFVLSEMARRFVDKLGFTSEIERPIDVSELDEFSISCHPSVTKNEKLSFSDSMKYRGVSINLNFRSVMIGQNRYYTTEEIISAFYDLYSNFSLEDA